MSQAATEGQEPTGTGTGTGQEPTGAGAGAGQEPGNQNGGTGNGTPGQIDVDAIADPAVKAFVIAQQKAAKEAREDAAKHRTRATALEAQKTEFERLSESAEQTAQREAAEREAERQKLLDENRNLKVGAVLRSAAETAKAYDPDTVLTLIGSKVTLDEQGAPTNVADLMAELKADKPFLFKRNGANAGEGENADSLDGDDMNSRIRRAAGRGV